MSDRIKRDDVRSAFSAFVNTAIRLGFDVTGWRLSTPDIAAPWQLIREVTTDTSRHLSDTEFPRYLGSTNREAYERLTSWSQALQAIEIQRSN